MRTLHVLFDPDCGLCRRAARWLHAQPAFIDIFTLSSTGEAARRKFPALGLETKPEEVIAVADTGEVYRGPSAWLMCLWATKSYRALSLTLADPGWRPFIARAIDLISANRQRIAWFLGEDATTSALEAIKEAGGTAAQCPSCEGGGACPIAAAGPPATMDRLRDAVSRTRERTV